LERSILIALPIIVLENGDLNLFASAEDVDAELEAVDVRDGLLVAYDATGRRLRLEVEGRLGVRVTEDPAGLRDPQPLERALRHYLQASGVHASAEASLADLVQVAVDKVGFTGR
jgi:hypothetical protein